MQSCHKNNTSVVQSCTALDFYSEKNRWDQINALLHNFKVIS